MEVSLCVQNTRQACCKGTGGYKNVCPVDRPVAGWFEKCVSASQGVNDVCVHQHWCVGLILGTSGGVPVRAHVEDVSTVSPIPPYLTSVVHLTITSYCMNFKPIERKFQINKRITPTELHTHEYMYTYNEYNLVWVYYYIWAILLYIRGGTIYELSPSHNL